MGLFDKSRKKPGTPQPDAEADAALRDVVAGLNRLRREEFGEGAQAFKVYECPNGCQTVLSDMAQAPPCPKCGTRTVLKPLE